MPVPKTAFLEVVAKVWLSRVAAGPTNAPPSGLELQRQAFVFLRRGRVNVLLQDLKGFAAQMPAQTGVLPFAALAPVEA
jgi:hypothetical protein